MWRTWMVVVLCVACSSKSSERSSNVGSGSSTAGSGSAAAVAGPSIPVGPVPAGVKLPKVAPAHVRTVPAAAMFATIDESGIVTVGKLAPGATPYAGQQIDIHQPLGTALDNVAAGKPVDEAAPGSGSAKAPGLARQEAIERAKTGEPWFQEGPPDRIRGQIVSGGPVDTIVLVDGGLSATSLATAIGTAIKRKVAIGVAGPSGVARLDFVHYDWMRGGDHALKIVLGAKEIQIGALSERPYFIKPNELAAELAERVEKAKAKGEPTFVYMDFEAGISVDTFLATLGVLADAGVTDFDAGGPRPDLGSKLGK